MLHWHDLDAAALNVARLVEFMGGEVKFVKITEAALASPDLRQILVPPGGCVIVHASTLAQAARQKQAGTDTLRWLTDVAANCFVYGFEPSPDHGRFLRQLTGDTLVGTQDLPIGESQFVVDAGARKICRHFAGLSFGAPEPEYDSTFIAGTPRTGPTPLICIGTRPFFVSLKVQACEFLLLACRQIADLAEPVPRGASLVKFFSRLAPLLMFLRRAGGERLWHNASPRACLILDDPLLRRQYGFLDYEKLLALMERDRFSTSIAFIPWNYRRSNPRIAELFKTHPNRYSLCVHGCDHTGSEFGATDFQLLRRQAQKGLDRMRQHGQITGLGFDDVMVFPQGRFSTVALKALKACGYLAAVNSTPYPVDAADNPLHLRDLLEVAVTRFPGPPLFVRRYPKDVVGLAFDLFLGKAALLVEHHNYFRNGYSDLTDIVRRLNAMERLDWSNLSAICSQACLTRRTSTGEIHLRFYTERFMFRNDSRVAQDYVLFQRREPGEGAAEVTVNRVQVESRHESGELRIPISLTPGQTAEVCITGRKPAGADTAVEPERMREASVFVRRVLSEFRDNHVDKNPFLSRMASSVRNRLASRK